MNRFHGFFILAAAALIGLWWWKSNSVPSPLDEQFSALADRANVGTLANFMAWAAQPVSAMVGTGWGTTVQVNPTNPNSTNNSPGTLMLNMRFAQPGQAVNNLA